MKFFSGKFLKEFKNFINRGNVVDMAVGIVIGVSFEKIVNSLVHQILFPITGFLIGGIDFGSYQILLSKGKTPDQDISIGIGPFFNSIVDFLIIAFSVFLLLKGLTSLEKKIWKEEPPTKNLCPHCLMEVPPAAKRCGHCTSNLREEKT